MISVYFIYPHPPPDVILFVITGALASWVLYQDNGLNLRDCVLKGCNEHLGARRKSIRPPPACNAISILRNAINAKCTELFTL